MNQPTGQPIYNYPGSMIITQISDPPAGDPVIPDLGLIPNIISLVLKNIWEYGQISNNNMVTF